ncbi:MAG TPA: ergothioneine biosynthesis protein EgtB [Lacipirellulaceae bacterium]|nr:ergothioneine biosynthesis protein EgtB [Lacipirellulaceae bacterium]
MPKDAKRGLAALSGGSLAQRFASVRAFTTTLCETLSAEDCCLQSMPDASPTRWHLAHTSWFFETFLLRRDPAYRVFDEHYEVLFNSYYNSVGEQFPRARRGLLSRPSLADVAAYRRHVDEAVGTWLATGRVAESAELATIVEWGVQHEQQHQELILTDVKHLFSLNPLLPTFRPAKVAAPAAQPRGEAWIALDGGVVEIGFAGAGFAYDNETPRHRVFLEPFHMAAYPVTNREFAEFVADGGYTRPELWLAEGWSLVREQGLRRPLHWFGEAEGPQEFTLAGLRPLDPAAPVTHVSYFEADAFARWAGARLPTEAEWEVAAGRAGARGEFVDTLVAAGRAIHPSPLAIAEPQSAAVPSARAPGAAPDGSGPDGAGPRQMLGDVWEWTASPYTPYPGYRPPTGALGEYNGKFMCNQYVLRGGSCATPSSHIRATYRNFFPASARWQFSGIRLAR